MASAYTPTQLLTFLSYIQLPPKYHPSAQPKHDLSFLTALHIHTISRIPYENLSLHYSPTHTISIDPQIVFQKIVGDARGRGGYCMEHSIFFNHVLRGLGFEAYTAGVRIRLRENGVPVGDFTGWRHIVNIVTLPTGEKYMVDTGFGGDGATRPLPMTTTGLETPLTNLGSQQIRLIRDHIPQQTHCRGDASKLWIYQYRNGVGREWNSFYAFGEFEFLHDDFNVMNWYTGSSPESFQVSTVLVVKFLGRRKVGVDGKEDEEEEIYGKRMLVQGIVKENLGGKTQIIQECRIEAGRLEALEKLFGMTFTEEEKAGIVGHRTELK